MKKRSSERTFTFFLMTAVFILLACNMPSALTEAPVQATEAPVQTSPEDIALTIVAQTAQAATQETPSVTPTASGVTVTVSTATNCRTGPDTVYPILMVVQPGSTMTVVGKYSSNYWIVNMPTGGTCWLWGQYSTVVGNTSILPEIVPPPAPVVVQSSDTNSNDSGNTNDSNSDSSDDNSNSGTVLVPLVPIGPLLLLPAPPTNLDISRTCVTLTKPGDLFPSFQQTTTFTWTDASSNETGFNVFKDGALLATVGANGQQYIDKFTVLLPQSSTATYGVQAVGQNGNSSTKTISVQYCK
ncbi:MAG: SH3 domain-containing protein [Anaerolineales bacterium]